MAQRRMFSLKIVSSDAFLDMPTSTRELYFQFGMYADDDGFVNPKKVMRMIGASEDDLKMLIAKRFVLPFENGIIVIKAWKVNNLIRKDFYQPTQYLDQKKTLFTKGDGSYTDNPSESSQNVNILSPQVRLGKDSIGKEIQLPNWLNKKSWDEWLEFRKEIKKKMTPTTIKKQIQFLFLNQDDHVRIINQSIMNGWQGLFVLKKDFKPREIPKRDEQKESSVSDSFKIKGHIDETLGVFVQDK